MNFNEVEFGKRIRNLRTDRNITQDQLAEELNISCRHLRNIENGAKAPSYDILLTISELFSKPLLGDAPTLPEISDSVSKLDLIKIHFSSFPPAAEEQRIQSQEPGQSLMPDLSALKKGYKCLGETVLYFLNSFFTGICILSP